MDPRATVAAGEDFARLPPGEQSRVCSRLAEDLGAEISYLEGESGPAGHWFRRAEDRLRLFPGSTLHAGCSDADLLLVTAALESMGMSRAEVDELELKSLLDHPRFSVRVPPFLAGDRLVRLPFIRSHDEQAGAKGEAMEYRDGVDAPALLDASEAVLVVRRSGMELLEEVQWLVVAQSGHGAFSWLGGPLASVDALDPDVRYDGGDPGDIVTPSGIRDLGVGEYVRAPAQGRGPDDLMVRGGGSLSWPWQHPAEWLLCLNDSRAPAGAVPYAGLRPAVQLGQSLR